MSAQALRVKKSNARRRRKVARDRHKRPAPATNPNPRRWSLRRKGRKVAQLRRRSRHMRRAEAWLKYMAAKWSVTPPPTDADEPTR